MTATQTADIVLHAAMIAGAIFLFLNKDVEQTSVDDPRRTWRMNAILAFICAIYVVRGDSDSVYGSGGILGVVIAWGMAAVWIGHAIWTLGLLHPVSAPRELPRLMPMTLGITTTALVGLLEELLFRGAIQNEVYANVQGMNAEIYGIFALNLAFGLMHYNRGFTFAMSAGFVGMIFSVATLASGSLLPAIVMHVGWNVLMGMARMLPQEVARSAG